MVYNVVNVNGSQGCFRFIHVFITCLENRDLFIKNLHKKQHITKFVAINAVFDPRRVDNEQR